LWEVGSSGWRIWRAVGGDGLVVGSTVLIVIERLIVAERLIVIARLIVAGRLIVVERLLFFHFCIVVYTNQNISVLLLKLEKLTM
jgi:hypothetical protein